MHPLVRSTSVLAILTALFLTTGLARAADLPDAVTSVKNSVPANDATASGTMSLDDLQDVAFTLHRIHEEAIDMFLEATRKKGAKLDQSVFGITSMPTISFEDQSSYLPLRKGWLGFFIATMEPLVHILNEQLKHLDDVSVKNSIPTAKMPEWHGIEADWTTAIHGLNQQLDVCSGLLDDSSADNVEVAKSAQAIDRQVSVLKDIMLRANKLEQEISSTSRVYN